ncbi:hypothetical protein ACHAWU_010224 [Discostella pseudostelligera]|uniref:Ubiquitin-like domain-containing protein n=1 Tax=Discostella pseudostelligera TaxID=259834 RepID=A0ABD3MB96_9STRA
MSNANSNKRARRGQPKRSSFADDLNSRTLPAAVNLLRKLDDVDFGNFESQLQPFADGMECITKEEPSTLLRECLKFLVLKKIAGDEDATTLSPTDVIDAVWHQLLLNPRLYKSINDSLGGEMIDHNPEGGRDVDSRNERVTRTIEMYKSIYNITPAMGSVWMGPELPPKQKETITLRIKDLTGEETYFKVRQSTSIWKLKYQFCLQKGIVSSMESMMFLLDGDNLDDNKPISYYDIEDNYQIDCVLKRVGC